MRKILIVFIIGSAAGFATALGLLFDTKTVIVECGEEKILDDVIQSWTSSDMSSPTIAGFPSKVELPDARPGYFPDTVRALAHLIDSVYHVPAGVTLCQFALESSWGRSNLGLSNYFGHSFAAVKPYLQNPRWAYRKDLVSMNGGPWKKQKVAFAEYENIAECFATHGKYLQGSKRYEKAFKTRSSENFARAIAEAGYAQDPQYALKLVTIMRRYKLN